MSMNLERLELTYTIEPLRMWDGNIVDQVWLTVERFTSQGATGAVGKHAVGRMLEVVEASRIARKAFEPTPDYVGNRHPRDVGMLASHLREAVIPTAQNLTALLIPSELGREMQAAEAPLAIEFRVDPVLNQVPWELLFLGQDFLSFTHATGRLVLSHTVHSVTPKRNREGTLRGAYIVDPCPIGEGRLDATLTRAATEVIGHWARGSGDERIRFGTETVRIGDPITSGRLTALLQQNDLLMVLGHHNDRSRATPEAPEDEGLVIVDAGGRGPALYSPAMLLQALQAPNVPPELLFWLACESGLSTGWGEDWPNDRRIYGFVDAAVRAGVTHFIGSSTLVPQAAAVDLVEPFLLALAMGCSVGEALRRARVAARRGSVDPADGGSLVGLAFSLFGRPSLGLFHAGGRRIGGLLAHPCQHVEQGVHCGLLYLPGEPGAGNQRCAVHAHIPSLPPLRREPCGDPYGKHGGEKCWVTPVDDGWAGAVRRLRDPVERPMRLCDACRRLAAIEGDLVLPQDLP
jgi:hypothetical protein